MKRGFLICAVIAVLMSVATLVSADNLTEVAISTKLDIYVWTTSVPPSAPAYTYTIPEINAIPNQVTEQWYSSVDAMPARVWTIASGVRIDMLFDDFDAKTNYVYDVFMAQAYGGRVRFTCDDDGYYRTYSFDDAVGNGIQYTFDGLFHTNTFEMTAGGWRVDVADVLSYQYEMVLPMLATSSYQARFWPGDQLGETKTLSTNDSLRYCRGQTINDLQTGNSTTSQFGRGINRIDIFMSAAAYDGKGTAVTGVIVSDELATLDVGDTKTLSATVIPSDATNKAITWTSSNPAVASVSNGVVTANAAGTATITARSNNNARYYATCAVTVNAAATSANTASSVSASNYASSASVSTSVSASARASSSNSAYAITSASVSVSESSHKSVSVSTSASASTSTSAVASVSVSESASESVSTSVSASENAESSSESSSAPEFNDIRGHWAASDIRKLAQVGIMQGYPDGGFHPNSNITRAEFVTILMRFVERDGAYNAAVGAGFPDTTKHWARADINKAVALGIVTGYTDGTFKPDKLITREEMANLISRVYKLTINGSVSGSAVDIVKAAGLMVGDPNGDFRLKANATRAESATILVRLLDIAEVNS
jgi:uncharacterized protein YjdB